MTDLQTIDVGNYCLCCGNRASMYGAAWGPDPYGECAREVCVICLEAIPMDGVNKCCYGTNLAYPPQQRHINCSCKAAESDRIIREHLDTFSDAWQGLADLSDAEETERRYRENPDSFVKYDDHKPSREEAQREYWPFLGGSKPD